MKIGPITLTRDSAWWGVSAVLSAAAMLATFTDPSGPMSLAYYGIPASWLPYIRLLALLNTWLSGKMANSPAPSSGEVARGIRDCGKPLVLLLALGLAIGSTGCAGLLGARHRAQVTITSAHAVLSTIQDDEMLIVCGRPTAPAPPKCVPPERHRAISAKLATAFDLDAKVQRVVRAVPPGGPVPDVATFLGQIGALIDEVLGLIPDSPTKAFLVKKTLGGA